MEKTTSRIRGSTPEIELNARNLRQNLTPAEQILWQHLRNRKLHGLKFRRQHPIGRFIVDFYCPEYRLIVELDGEIHDRQVEYDMARTEQLQADGDRVLRFQNQEVLDRLSWVLEQILQGLHSQP
ncbi:MAG: endonuclease domain-containing protein [Cyanosarcina radialis HA8281-LM2]|nr:endonuclease domain-containing protein [Cyanosarcina radialis HA8281-LM2]